MGSSFNATVTGSEETHHCQSDFARHTKAEKYSAHQELVAPSQVDLKNCHVADCADQKQNHEDAAYGDVDFDGRHFSN
jgi:hypothetical protein